MIVAAVGCGGQDTTQVGGREPVVAEPAEETVAPSLAPADSSSPSAIAGPLYALATHVFDDTTASTYLSLLDAIQERADIDLAGAREFPGWAIPGSFGRHLFISDSEAPELTRYSVNSRGFLEGGETLSFANYTSGIAPLYANHFIDSTTALMNLDQTTRVLWDPSALVVRGEAERPAAPAERDGLGVAVYSHAGAVRADGVFQSYYWHDDDWYAFHPESSIAVYGLDDAGLESVIETPCPALHQASADEEGNLYFSQLGDIIAYQLLDADAPPSCLVRINVGEQAIAADWPKSFSELTDGRRTGEFHYLRDGFGLLSVYHHERAEIGPDTDKASLLAAENWRLWLVDLDAWEAAPIDALGWLSAGIHLSIVEGRAFLFTSSADFSTTTVHEVSTDGSVLRLFATPGYAEKFVTLVEAQ